MLGIANAILLSQAAVFKNSAPMSKITPMGAMQAVLENSQPRVLSNVVDDGTGYIRDVKIRAKKRMPTGLSNVGDNCVVNSEPAYFEQTIPALSTRSYGVFFEFDKIEAYAANALQVTKGVGSIQMAQEFMEELMVKMNGLLGDVNADIFTAMASNFGRHAASGSNAVRAVNFPLSGASNNLDEGFSRLISDMALNETQWQQLKAIGAGKSFIVWQQHLRNMISANQSGVNSGALSMPNYYFDPTTSSILGGADEFVIMDKDAVQFLNVCKFRNYKGRAVADSEFGTFPVALTDSLGNPIRSIELDVQVKYHTCPSDVEILESGDYPEASAKGRGVSVFLIARYAPVFQDAASYVSTDRLYLNNGVYNYNATNS